ncbi:hypothetical protein QM201_16645 [Enterobacter asburiae]|nr:hypothetical protein [Enterobacter asburiae]
MDVLAILLFVVCILLVMIYKKISIPPQAEAHDNIDKNELIYEISRVREEIEMVNSTLNEIKYVTDIIEKYKLPDRKEREFIDQIRIDDEISERMNSSKL